MSPPPRLRVGVIGEARFDRVRLSLEGAYLPVVSLSGVDRHWLRPDINPGPEGGRGDGYFLEGIIAYDLTPSVSVGVGGRYWKKRHDRKRDAIRGGFNQGITTRNAGPADDPNQSGVLEPAGGRDSPMRTRENFMPYGYGYTRSESRLGSHGDSLARGATPVNELEKGGAEEGTPRKKSRRVLVRERSEWWGECADAEREGHGGAVIRRARGNGEVDG